METLADFKKIMKEGTWWSTYHHGQKKKIRPRMVSVVTGRMFAFSTRMGDGTIKNLGCAWPLASGISFTKGGTVHIKGYLHGQWKTLMSYKQVKEPKKKKKGNGE